MSKSAEQKAREEAKATVDAWALTPGVDMPFMGAGSSGFDLLGFWDSVDLGAGTEGAKAVACASFGWKASADGPQSSLLRCRPTVVTCTSQVFKHEYSLSGQIMA